MTKKGSIKETGEEETPDDQWRRFEAAVDAAVKSGPKRRIISDKSKRNGEKGGEIAR